MSKNCWDTKFVQTNWRNTEEWGVVSNIASQLIEYLSDEEIYELITTANQPGNKSSEIQNIVMFKIQRTFAPDSFQVF